MNTVIVYREYYFMSFGILRYLKKKKQDLSRYRRFIEYLLFRVTRVLYDVTGENSEKEILVLFFFFFTNIKYTNM